jgi:hypothetical protein
MDLQTKQLLEKYWQGETNLAEEKQIREYFKQHPDLSPEGQYFRETASSRKEVSERVFMHPAKKRKLVWLSVAAAVLIAVMTLPFVFNHETTQDQFAVDNPTEAYEITRASLMMVSNGLNKGKTFTKKELNKINEAKTIIIN